MAAWTWPGISISGTTVIPRAAAYSTIVITTHLRFDDASG